ncbi:pentapeptide MXKDX repeat protein [Dyella amyloliquefaciens]|uniref:pentapeptide MXKDX repeat protein n=1 Tax=Dyella amyloliquefaciens TaxID=1770545 RepID=UPI00102E5288|nr:pentapeptide MXKDX repeat protein [Dyella amyloliquefaciens]
MKTVISLVLAASFACASVAFAQDAMQPASAGSAMKQDAMKSSDTMMKKDASGMKHDSMKKHDAKKGDAMQHGDAMKKDAGSTDGGAMSGGQ